MPTKRLPSKADIRHLKLQAKDLLHAFSIGRIDAFQRIREFHPQRHHCEDVDVQAMIFTLTDAQLTIAREYGFKSWPRIREIVAKQSGQELSLAHHERIEDTQFRQAVDLLDYGNAQGLRKHLMNNPHLVDQTIEFEGGNYFKQPTLLEFIAENPVRHGKLPVNIMEVASVILEAGGQNNQVSLNETLLLVSTGTVVQKSGVQIPLINLLCDYGGQPDYAIPSALAHGEFSAVDALVNRGAAVDLPLAAGTNRIQDVQRLLADAKEPQLHLAMALSAQHGHAKIVSTLLHAGVDPNRYNPEGGHSHSTPLHEAALEGHLDVVRVLVAGGADLHMKDIHHHATPLAWARHAKRTTVVTFLEDFTKTQNVQI